MKPTIVVTFTDGCVYEVSLELTTVSITKDYVHVSSRQRSIASRVIPMLNVQDVAIPNGWKWEPTTGRIDRA